MKPFTATVTDPVPLAQFTLVTVGVKVPAHIGPSQAPRKPVPPLATGRSPLV